MGAAGRTVAIAAGIGVAVLLLILGGAALATRGMPPGTTLAGEPVSDPTAVEPLAEELDARLQQLPVTLVAEDRGVEVAAGELGVRLDAGSAVRLAARSTGIQAWVERLTGGPALELPLRVLFASGSAAELAEELSSPPVDGEVRITASGPQVSDPVDGIEVQARDLTDAFRSAISEVAALPSSEWPAVLEVPVEAATTSPRISQGAVDAVLDRIERLTDGGVELRSQRVPEDSQTVDGVGVPTREDVTVRLDGDELVQLLDVEPDPTNIERERLQVIASTATPPPALLSFLEDADIPPDLRVSVIDRSPTPQRVPADQTPDGPGGPADHPSYGDVSAVSGTLATEVAAPGLDPDVDLTILAIVQAMRERQPGEDVVVDVQGEEVVEGDAADLGIVAPVSTWTTFYEPGQSRVTNIHRIAELLDGTLVPPGGNLDINHAVGRRTPEKGFVTAGAILEGEFIDDVGGGVSQFGTTFFNAMWFSGIDIITHTPHSFWFDRYPAAREATIDYPGVDLELNNNTPHWILVDTSVTADSVTVTFWSTPWFEVQTTMGARQPTADGFRMTIERVSTSEDGRVDDDQFTVSYKLP